MGAGAVFTWLGERNGLRGAQARDRSLTALLLGLVRPVFAVLDGVADLGAVDALPVLAQELQGSLTFGGCGGGKGETAAKLIALHLKGSGVRRNVPSDSPNY